MGGTARIDFLFEWSSTLGASNSKAKQCAAFMSFTLGSLQGLVKNKSSALSPLGHIQRLQSWQLFQAIVWVSKTNAWQHLYTLQSCTVCYVEMNVAARCWALLAIKQANASVINCFQWASFICGCIYILRLYSIEKIFVNVYFTIKLFYNVFCGL